MSNSRPHRNQLILQFHRIKNLSYCLMPYPLPLIQLNRLR
nr:MAG TPA: hypothetical protein [Bacteriophage sp.]